MAHCARWTCLLLLLTVLPAVAADWRAALPTAQRLGDGDFTWLGMRLYTARLWTAGPAQDWNQPFALELLYHRKLSRDTLVQASLEEMRRLSAGTVSAQRLAEWTEAMAEAFVDVRPGTRIAALYLPGQGSRFYVDGTLRREIADPDFARMFFAIWLDPHARDPQLRQRLLGLAGND
ncbi:chalcone isomerase family protein [Pseudomonas sp. BP8]|uniref:chalcone isomerase family protein n=1 Tax=Pseudomonas sp. BP8 TaxID=2817864 RepID=UPI001AE95771|nr:chalcone isomerase family protein [Pseudomonas sp. BP8]HDS1736515.1 chalcone isomerase family protein [Pseudomonas putida]